MLLVQVALEHMSASATSTATHTITVLSCSAAWCSCRVHTGHHLMEQESASSSDQHHFLSTGYLGQLQKVLLQTTHLEPHEEQDPEASHANLHWREERCEQLLAPQAVLSHSIGIKAVGHGFHKAKCSQKPNAILANLQVPKASSGRMQCRTQCKLDACGKHSLSLLAACHFDVTCAPGEDLAAWGAAAERQRH